MSSRSPIMHPGAEIAGYRIEDVIGIGGMAVVYRAEQLSLGRPVALKVLSAQLSRNVAFQERFRREGKHAAALEHANIVPVYDQGEAEGRLFIAMRLIDGETLGDRMSGRGLSARDSLALAQALGSALDAAHTAGVIHRDVKPQNILISEAGKPYLADFGVAKAAAAPGLTATGNFIGSVHYASPEQIRGETLTPASDVYALTAVLYQCFTGEVPFPRQTEAGVIHAHLNEPPPRLRVVNPDAPAALDEVIRRGLAKHPRERIGSAGALARLAEKALHSVSETQLTVIPAFPVSAPSAATETESPASPLTTSSTVDVPPRAPTVDDPASVTVHDRRRATSLRPTAPAPRRSRRPLWIACACVFAVAAPATAYAISSPPDPPTTFRADAGALVLTYGPGWKPAPHGEAKAVPGLRRPLTLIAPGEAVTAHAGALAEPATIPGALPDELSPSTSPKPTAVRLGTLPALRYDLPAKGRTLASRLFVIPTTAGDQAIDCQTATPPSTAQASVCDELAGAVRLRAGVTPASAGVDVTLASGMAKALAPLATARRRETARLASSSSATRARSSARLAREHSTAARAFGALEPRSADARAVERTHAALRSLATDFRRLSAAAARRSRVSYNRARTQTRADDAALRRALRTLRAHGYGR